MSRVMQIGASDDVFERALHALNEEDAKGRRALKWLMGKEVQAKIDARCGLTVAWDKEPTLYGVAIKVLDSGPPDLLHLDVF